MIRNRKFVWISLLLMIMAALGYMGYYTYGRTIDVAIEGVNYQLGPEHRDNAQPETVRLKGTLSRSLTGARTFKGTIEFDRDPIAAPEDGRAMTVQFAKNGYGPIIYEYAGSRIDLPPAYSFGVLFANADFSSVTYLRMRKAVGKNGSVGGDWNGGDGLMFAGPAKTREQALAVSNELMKKFLRTDNGDRLSSVYILQ